MTNPGGGDDGAPKAVPEGVLADAALKKEEKPTAQVPGSEMLKHPSPTTLPVDPNYFEPLTLDKFKEMASAIDKEWAANGNDERCRLERGSLIEFLLKRVEQLEGGLMPFANMALMMSNARLCLIADGRRDEPAGGTWLSNVQGIQMQANEGIFFNACDAYGRQRIQDHMVKVFQAMQEAAKLQAEKDAHLEAGGRADH